MWQTWHVIYYQPQKDELLLSCLEPLLRRLVEAGTLERYSLRTRWRQGPRVIADLQARPGQEEALAHAFEQEVGAWLAERPSHGDTTPEQMLALHRRLAALELEPGPLEPLDADNSVLRMPYQPPYAGVGANTERMAQEFYAEATPLLLEVMKRTRGGGLHRQDQLFQLLLSLTLTVGDLRYSHFSLRSHCEVFLQRFDTRQELRGKLEEYVQGHQAQLLGTLEQVRRHVEGEGEDGVLRAWAALCRRLMKELEQLAASGSLTLPTAEDLAARRGPRAPQALSFTWSEFHRTVLHTRSFQQVSSTPPFLAMRCLIGWHYGILTLAGLVPLERVKLGYLISRTAELAVGITWAELIRQHGSEAAQ